MGALMLTTPQATSLEEPPVHTGQLLAAELRNRNVVERAAWEVALDIAEASAVLPIDDTPHPHWLHAPWDRIVASTTETLDSLTRRVDAGFVSAWSFGACVALVRVAFGRTEPVWGWSGRSTLIEALVRRASHQLVERYEVVVCVREPPESDGGARAFDLFDRLMRMVDTRGILRLQFTH